MTTEDTRVDRLKVARDRLVTLLDAETDGSKAASLAREIRALEAELAELAPAPRRSGIDDLAKRRKDRLADPSGSDPAAVRK